MKNKILIIMALMVGLSFAQKPNTRTPQSGDWINVIDSDGMVWDYTVNQVLTASLNPTFTDLTISGDADVVGALTAGSMTSDAGISSLTATVSDSVFADTLETNVAYVGKTTATDIYSSTRTTTSNNYQDMINTEWTCGGDMASGGSNGIYAIANPVDTLQNAYALRGRMDLRDATDDVYVNQLHAIDALINLSDIDTVNYFADDNISVMGAAIHGGVTGALMDGTGTGSLGGATLNLYQGVWGPTAEQDYSLETNFAKFISHAGTTVDYGLNIESSSDMDAGILLNNHASNSPATMDVGIEMISASSKMVYGIDMDAADMTTADLRLNKGALINNNHADSLTITESMTVIDGDLTVSGDADVVGAFTANSVASDGAVSGTTITGSAKLDIDQAVSGGSAVGNIIKLTQAAGETYSGTTAGLTVKNYDADGTVVHGSDENTGLVVFMKQQSASGTGGENSIMSLHSHSSAVGKLDHGLIMYPDTVGSAIAVRDAVVDYGLDFADRDNVTINNAEIRGSNGETIDNTTDGVWDFGTARVQLDSIWHAYGGFEDSSITIDLTQNTWANIKNAGGTLWGIDHSNGFSMSGDTLTIENSGHYSGSLSITLSGANNDEVYMRIYNVTQDDSTYKIGFTGVGATAFRNVTMPIYLTATANDEFVLQLLNTDSNDDAIIRSAIFHMTYLHD